MIKIISKFRLLYEDEKVCLFYHKGNVLVKRINKSSMTKIHIPMSHINKFIVKIRLFERLLRLEPRFAYMYNDEFLISFKGYLYRLNIDDKSFAVECKYRNGMNNPLSLCVCENEDNKRVLFGEYWGNGEREKVCIFQKKNNYKWEKVYSFAEESITHIHQIVYDKYRNVYWILTGDQDDESAIWKSDLDFNTVIPILQGSQKYRSCFLLPLQNGILYATDSPIHKNAIYFVDLNYKSIKIQKVFDMPGPCIYGKKVNEDYIVLATSVEPDSTISSYRYIFSRKLGRGVLSNSSSIIFGSINDGFRIIASDKKDKLPMGLFQFGNFYFPDGILSNNIKATGVALKRYDSKTIEIQRGE